MRRAREDRFREKPVAQSRLLFDGELVTLARYGEERHITREVKTVDKKSHKAAISYAARNNLS